MTVFCWAARKVAWMDTVRAERKVWMMVGQMAVLKAVASDFEMVVEMVY
jgi:hypothetical protein